MLQRSEPDEPICNDCSVHTGNRSNWYMLTYKLWHSLTPDKARFLCVECVEKRLGRSLRLTDLSDVPVNTTFIEERKKSHSNLLFQK